jgi:diadenosine tetraphosphatase ApaH/serine/threonine PP2A family protein phosphatase
MKLAFLSDIHANLQALEACLDHARAQGADQFAFLGDFVGYGANPVQVLDQIEELVANGAYAVKGNHDEMAVNVPQATGNMGASTAAWTNATLRQDQKAFLDRLPMSLAIDQILLVHASADDPEKWRYVTDERSAGASLDAAWVTAPNDSEGRPAQWVFGGHVHQQSLYYKGLSGGLMPFTPTPGISIPVPKHRRWLATVGSVGQPRDGNADAMYAIFDTQRHVLAFQRVRYDHESASAAIRQAGLPTFFADRLEMGR